MQHLILQTVDYLGKPFNLSSTFILETRQRLQTMGYYRMLVFEKGYFVQYKNRHLVILHSLSIKAQTVYSMSKGEVGQVTAATEMGVHHACKALEAEGLIESKASRSGARSTVLKKITKKGKELLNSLRDSQVKTIPTSISDLYVLDNIKNAPEVHEAMVSLLVQKKAKIMSGTAKEWYGYVIAKYSQAV